MNLAIDIGGTKTLICSFNDKGDILSEQKIKTPENYQEFIESIKHIVDVFTTKIEKVIVGAPGKIDRQNGVAIAFGNLNWRNVPLKQDIGVVCATTNVIVENDANLAGLGEVAQLENKPHKALYLTVSTGIGCGIITDARLDPDFLDSEVGIMLYPDDGKLTPWEKFASGQAIHAKYDKLASEIDDPEIWNEITKNLALGIHNIQAVIDSEIIIIGGGVGTHFNKYGDLLRKNLNEISGIMLKQPQIIQAKKPELAVILGCIELARQQSQQ